MNAGVRSIFVAFVTSLAVVDATGTAAVAQSPAPVQITRCMVRQYLPSRPAFRRAYWYDYGFSGPLVPPGSPYTDGIDIRYVNSSSQVADRVVFGVNYRGDFERIVDAGTFSPNAAIDHTFADVFSGYAYLGPKPNSCVVRVVRFRDGSVWRAPGVAPRRQQPG